MITQTASPPDLRLLFVAWRLAPANVKTALIEEQKLPADTHFWWVCRSGMNALMAAVSHKAGPLQLKPTGQWAEISSSAQTQLSSLPDNP